MSFGRRRTSQPSSRANAPTGAARRAEVEAAIPVGLEIGGQFAWRILVIAIMVIGIAFAVTQLREIVIPLAIAVLISALLVPFVNVLTRHHWRRGLAVAVAMVVAVAVVGGLIFLVVTQVQDGASQLATRSVDAFNQFKHFLATSPLKIDEAQFSSYIDKGVAELQKNSGALLSGALTVGTTAGHLVTGLLLTVFSTIFILIDGKGIWAWIVRIFPRKARPAVDGAGKAGWVTLTTFVKVQIFVAFVDAVGIGLGAFIIGLFYGGFPLVVPIAVAVFLGSFVPVVGAVLTGAVAVVIALVYLGPFPALLMLVVVLLVQELEGHVLQPIVMGTAVKVHALAVVLGVAAASFLAGIPGALFAVPFIAVLNVMVKYIASGEWRRDRNPDADELARTTEVVKENG